MPQTRANVEVQSFQGGLRTELNPLNSDINTASTFNNWVLSKDGSIRPRGKLSQKSISVNPSLNNFSNITSYYEWSVSTGVLFKVVGTDSNMFIYADNIASTGSPLFSVQGNFSVAKYANVGDDLIIANAESSSDFSFSTVATISYNPSNSTQFELNGRLPILVNDFFGIDDGLRIGQQAPGLFFISGMNSSQINAISLRTYNLLNEGFLPKHLSAFIDRGLPSLALVTTPIPTRVTPFTTGFNSEDNFSPDQMRKASDIRGVSESPRGKAIIDLLNRGSSRVDFLDNIGTHTDTRYTAQTLDDKDDDTFSYEPGSISADTSAGGTIHPAAFQGRMFYGFSGWRTGSNAISTTPDVNTFICFSRSLTNIERVNQCHQQNDPTSSTASDILDSDGGFIEIPGLGIVQDLVALEESLIIFADNGVWEIRPVDNVFTPTNYTVRKITSKGSLNQHSEVQFESSIAYISEDGVELIQSDERSGRLFATNISKVSVDRLVLSLLENSDLTSSAYDRINRKVYWLFQRKGSIEDYDILILDTVLSSFTTYSLESSETTSAGTLPGGFLAHLTTVRDTIVNSLSGTVTEAIGFVNYTHVSDGPGDDIAEFFFDEDDAGVQATLLTNVDTLGDGSRYKNVQWLTIFMEQTEQTQTATGLENESSCKVQVRWDFADSENSNKFSPEFEAYRLRRFNASSSTTFDYGQSIIATRNKIRGRGRSLAIQLKSTPGKRCHVYGYNIDLAGNATT